MVWNRAADLPHGAAVEMLRGRIGRRAFREGQHEASRSAILDDAAKDLYEARQVAAIPDARDQDC